MKGFCDIQDKKRHLTSFTIGKMVLIALPKRKVTSKSLAVN
jgi:hypothetical protein